MKYSCLFSNSINSKHYYILFFFPIFENLIIKIFIFFFKSKQLMIKFQLKDTSTGLPFRDIMQEVFFSRYSEPKLQMFYFLLKLKKVTQRPFYFLQMVFNTQLIVTVSHIQLTQNCSHFTPTKTSSDEQSVKRVSTTSYGTCLKSVYLHGTKLRYTRYEQNFYMNFDYNQLTPNISHSTFSLYIFRSSIHAVDSN